VKTALARVTLDIIQPVPCRIERVVDPVFSFVHNIWYFPRLDIALRCLDCDLDHNIPALERNACRCEPLKALIPLGIARRISRAQVFSRVALKHATVAKAYRPSRSHEGAHGSRDELGLFIPGERTKII